MATGRYVATKQEYLVPCSHDLCALLHAHLATERKADGPSYEGYYDARGTLRHVRTNWIHESTRVEWVVIDTTTGQRADGALSDSFDRKRDAAQAIARAGA